MSTSLSGISLQNAVQSFVDSATRVPSSFPVAGGATVDLPVKLARSAEKGAAGQTVRMFHFSLPCGGRVDIRDRGQLPGKALLDAIRGKGDWRPWDDEGPVVINIVLK